MFTLHIFLLILSLNKSLKFILSMLIILYLWVNAVIKKIKIGLPDFYVLCYFDFYYFSIHMIYMTMSLERSQTYFQPYLFFYLKIVRIVLYIHFFLLLIQLYVLYVLFSYATFMGQCCNKNIKILLKKFTIFVPQDQIMNRDHLDLKPEPLSLRLISQIPRTDFSKSIDQLSVL